MIFFPQVCNDEKGVQLGNSKRNNSNSNKREKEEKKKPRIIFTKKKKKVDEHGKGKKRGEVPPA